MLGAAVWVGRQRWGFRPGRSGSTSQPPLWSAAARSDQDAFDDSHREGDHALQHGGEPSAKGPTMGINDGERNPRLDPSSRDRRSVAEG